MCKSESCLVVSTIVLVRLRRVEVNTVFYSTVVTISIAAVRQK